MWCWWQWRWRCRWLRVCLWFLCDNISNSDPDFFIFHFLMTFISYFYFFRELHVYILYWVYIFLLIRLRILVCVGIITGVITSWQLLMTYIYVCVCIVNIWAHFSANKVNTGNIIWKTRNRIINMAYFLYLYWQCAIVSLCCMYVYVCVCV